MLRRINVVEKVKKHINWYVEKDKSWNLAAAIWYVKKDKCGWKSEETTYWYVEKDKSWNTLRRINVVEKVKKHIIDMLRRIKVET